MTTPKIILNIIIYFGIFIALSQPAFALSFFDNPQCKTYEEEVDIRIRDYGTKKDLQVRRFQDIKTDINSVLRDLKKDGTDTLAIEQNLKQIDPLTEKMSVDYTKLKSVLEQAKDLDCQKDKSKIEKLLQEAKKSSNDLKNTSLRVKNLYQTQIKPDLKRL